MSVIASVISCTICLAANLYMTVNARTPWIKWAAGITAGLCVALMGVDAWLLGQRY